MRLLRTTTVLMVALLSGGTLLTWGALLTWQAWARPSPTGAPLPPAEDAVVGAAGLGLTATGAWLTLVTLVCFADLARGAPGVGRSSTLRPAAVRRALLRACAPTVGAALLSVAPPATATPEDPAGPAVLQGLPLPERPTLSVPAGPSAEQRPTSRRAQVRTVLPGDCLWTITETLLGPHASPADVDRGWRALYRANRERIGGDPDLVAAGTRLLVPPSLHRPRHPSR